ncbi:hypothetical protein Tco_0736391 [Tanacetum coccineum]
MKGTSSVEVEIYVRNQRNPQLIFEMYQEAENCHDRQHHTLWETTFGLTLDVYSQLTSSSCNKWESSNRLLFTRLLFWQFASLLLYLLHRLSNQIKQRLSVEYLDAHI